MKYNERIAKLGVSGTNPDISRDITVELFVEGTFPIIAMSQTDGAGPVTTESSVIDSVEYNRAVASTLTETDPASVYNVLVDPDDPARYLLMGKVNMILTKDAYVLYYDKKYKDILLVPDMTSVGNGVRENASSSQQLIYSIYSVGYSDQYHDKPTDVAVMTETTYPRLPEPTPILKTKTHVMSIGRTTSGPHNNFGVMMGNVYAESGVHGHTNAISIGSTATLFGGPINVGLPIRKFSSEVKLLPAHTDAEDLLIVLPF